MGYYTGFTLTADNQEALDSIVDDHAEDGDDTFFNFLEKRNDGSYSGNCKGYEHEEELAEASKKFPDVLFTLDGHGEEDGDTWRKFFKNGKINDSILTFSNFDPKYMREPRG